MKLTRLALSNPTAVIAAILMVLLMGVIGLLSLPVQMIPDVQRPYIQINTGWRSAAPGEVESEIVEPQEDMLRGIPGLENMTSSASRGRASISLSFSVETDLQRALIEVMNRLNQVPRHTGNALDTREHHFSYEITVAGHLPPVAGLRRDGKPRDGRPELIPTCINPGFGDIIRVARYLIEPIHDFDKGTLQIGFDRK